ncbi:MobQ family relaxase [Priestia megaterium]|uniref:MobQ family relaxase n=1 Tax=Priestia megaterium TaxID=1404 RepID=UPI002FFFC9AF
MAIYHLSMQIISRSKGQSAVASASYRSGEKLTDERTNETKYYHREVKPETMILAPSNSPSWVTDRERLWNEVEKVEKRKDSQLARELNIALPRELSNEQQRELIKNYVQEQFVNKGMVADVAIHRDDEQNPHSHVMLTMRTLDEKGFGKKNRDWNADFANVKENNRGYVKSSKDCLSVREQWASYANKALEKAQVNERISHLSHEARGLETLPTVHLGHVAKEMEKKGKRSDRGDMNRERKLYNEVVIDLQQVRKQKQQLEAKIKREKETKEFTTGAEKVAIKKAVPVVKGYVSLESIAKRQQELNNWEAKLQKEQPRFFEKQEQFNLVAQNFKQQQSIQSQLVQKQNELNDLNKGFLSKFKNHDLKKDVEASIQKLEKDLKRYEDVIDSYRSNLGFTTYQDFQQKQQELFVEKEQTRERISKQKDVINEQRSILEQAGMALKQKDIREVASMYKELQSASQHLSHEDALKLKELTEKAGKVYPLKDLKEVVASREKQVDKARADLRIFEQEKERVKTAKSYMQKLDKLEQKIKSIETNPYEQGKLRNDKQALKDSQAYKHEANHYRENLRVLKFDDKGKFQKEEARLNKMEERVPMVQNAVRQHEQGTAKVSMPDTKENLSVGLLQAAIHAIEQAQRNQQMEQQKQIHKRKTKHKGQTFER